VRFNSRSHSLLGSILRRGDCFQMLNKGRQVFQDGIPHNVEVDVEVAMDQSVS